MGACAQDAVVVVAVVDDDLAILDAIRLLLRFYEWCVRTYATGEAFLADLDREPSPDCVILDPHLPGMDGADVILSIPNRHGPIPFIGLTAWPTSQLALAATDAGARVMLTKPVSEEELIGQVREALGNKSDI